MSVHANEQDEGQRRRKLCSSLNQSPVVMPSREICRRVQLRRRQLSLLCKQQNHSLIG